MSYIETAPVDMFTTLRPRLFRGSLLKDVKAVEASILRFGLLSPLVVSRSNGRLIVIDGRKRLAAIRRLGFMGRLPRSLVNIPFVEVENVRDSHVQPPVLMSNRELFTTITDMFRNHGNVEVIANDLYLTRKCVREILTLARLSKRVRRAFFDKVIDFNRAKAFAAIPNHISQDRAFMALGPFASEADIVEWVRTPTQQPPRLRLAA